MRKQGSFCLLILVALLFSVTTVQASECVNCHTNAETLKAVAAKLPKKVASTETKGKG